MTQRARKRSIDDPAGLKTSSYKEKYQAPCAAGEYTLPDVRVSIHERFINISGSIKGRLARLCLKQVPINLRNLVNTTKRTTKEASSFFV